MFGIGRFQGYRVSDLRKDVVSGFIVAVIAIPLGMAFAIAAGVKPEYGIYTTIIAGAIISFFGGTKFQIGGPTGAFIPILFAIVMQYGYVNLLIAGFMAGIMLVLMGLLRLGSIIRYMPTPVTVGFTAGIAVTIFSGQISNFLGLQNIERHEDFLSNMKEIVVNLNGMNGASIAVAAICLLIILTMPKLSPNLPSPIIGLILSAVLATLLFKGQVSTIGSAYGNIPSGLPRFHFPEITWATVKMLFQPALIIALLAAIESLLSAVVADNMAGTKHDSNRELVGQGIANMVTPLFGGIAATGAIARTAANIKSGAASPMSGIIHAVIVLIVLLIFAPYASGIPLASMAPILMVVAWNMSGRKAFVHLLRMKSSDSIVMFVTFTLTVFINLTMAVGFGLILAIVFFVKHMGDGMRVIKVLPDRSIKNEKMAEQMVGHRSHCPQIEIYTLEGPIFFGSSLPFERSIVKSIIPHTKVVFLRMAKVPFIDASGEERLSELIRYVRGEGLTVVISGIQPQPISMLEKTGLIEVIGVQHIFPHTGVALEHALQLIDKPHCIGCKQYAFHECWSFSAGFELEETHHTPNFGHKKRVTGESSTI